MKTKMVLNGWRIKQVKGTPQSAIEKANTLEAASEKDWIYAGVADQVQKILLDAGLLDPRVGVGETERCAWVEEADWLYACHFNIDPVQDRERIYLNFTGVDLFADFYLNGTYIGKHDDMLIPKRIEVTDLVRPQNCLLVYFHSTRRRMDELFAEMDDEYRRNSRPCMVLRKGQIEFGDAGKVAMINVGLYGDVLLERVDRAEITWPDIECDFDYWYRFADVQANVHVDGICPDMRIRACLYDPDGACLGKKEIAVENGEAPMIFRVNSPKLWWPVHYGGQPLYRLRLTLISGAAILDEVERMVGIRNVEKTGDMRFRINGKEIKQWGALIEPFNGLTHRWDSRKCREMIALTVHGNINTLRIWGGSMQFADEFYEECDRQGIMVWHEFCLCWHPAPEGESYAAVYRAEASHEVKRVKHHACVLMYCGGNESEVGFVEGLPEKLSRGWKPFLRDFKEVCQNLDPKRFYLDSSPCGGDYPSDPREGDTHPLYYTFRHAVAQYPLFVSEQARSTTGPLRSLRKFMSEEELWPEGYVNQVTASQYNPTYNVSYPDMPYYQYDPDYDQKYSVGWSVPRLVEGKPFTVTSWKKVPVPNTWWRRAASFFASECAPLERFFDAENIEELVYRINAATAWFFKDDLERIRRGKAHYQTGEPRRCQGYIYVKLNDTWPQFYCTLIDYFQEVYIPYYQFRRSLSPVLLSFDFQDRIFLWGVNDTLEEVQGQMQLRVFSQILNRVTHEFTIPVSIEPGESKVLTTLDRVCPIVTESVVHAELKDAEGHVISSSDTLVDIERHQTFPRAKLSLSMEEDTLVIHTDRYAHCVELNGDQDGDSFNWYFEDNYFNLLPYQEKRVKILGHHTHGTITAKAHFSDLVATIPYQK